MVTTTSDAGLLGLAFHPNYVTNGYFYIYYARASDGMSVIERYHVSTVTIAYQVSVIALSGILTNTATLDSSGLLATMTLEYSLTVPRPTATATPTATPTPLPTPTPTPTPTEVAPPSYPLWLPLVRK